MSLKNLSMNVILILRNWQYMLGKKQLWTLNFVKEGLKSNLKMSKNSGAEGQVFDYDAGMVSCQTNHLASVPSPFVCSGPPRRFQGRPPG